MLCIYRKFNDGTTTMEWFDDFVFVFTGEDKSAITAKLLNRGSKLELDVGSGIICFINNNDFVFCF